MENSFLYIKLVLVQKALTRRRKKWCSVKRHTIRIEKTLTFPYIFKRKQVYLALIATSTSFPHPLLCKKYKIPFTKSSCFILKIWYTTCNLHEPLFVVFLIAVYPWDIIVHVYSIYRGFNRNLGKLILYYTQLFSVKQARQNIWQHYAVHWACFFLFVLLVDILHS